MTSFQQLEKFLWYLFDKKNLNERHRKRLEWELKEIDVQSKADYFLELYKNKVRHQNQNNIIVPFILDICDEFDIDRDPNFVQGDMPDIDVDYLSEVRDHLKNKWAVETFGQDFVCNIGNYTTYGLKSALLDMVRVHGEPREEIMELTKSLDAKDDEGNRMTWDRAMEMYPKLKEYCDKHPDIASAAKKLINRNRGMGQHAGGLIISSVPLHDLVPLVKRKDNPQASAWVEGLSGQDLQPVGLVKFDLLVISNLQQISRCCEMIKKNHGITGICALPGQSDWSDINMWRNDPKALRMANEADLRCIFQFDSEGIRRLVLAGGVDKFEDLVAYTALYRPGPLGMLMHERYTQRKRGLEEYSLHPLVEPILGKTYGVMCYQEQIMKILNVVGEIPLRDCEIVRKAISKKKVSAFQKYETMFIQNGQKNLGVSEDEIKNLWNQIKSFAEYGFNLSHAVAYTYVSSRLLYLKAHYPQEFYTAVLSCETLSEKIKEYKIEAKRHGVDMERADINKSKETFDLVGNVIHFGLGNIKGIGEGPSKRIVAGQPYAGIEDFLSRFGTDASVMKCLISLRCFKESDPITLWKFYTHYKDCVRKIEDKKKRFVISMQSYDEEFKKLAPHSKVELSELVGDDPFSCEEWKHLDVVENIDVKRVVESNSGEKITEIEYVPVDNTDDFIEVQHVRFLKTIVTRRAFNRLKELKKLWNKRNKSLERNGSTISTGLPRLIDFDPSKHDIDKSLAKELRSESGCEKKMYGFAWMHNLEKSPEFKGNTFQMLRENEGCIVPVEIEVTSVKNCKSQKGNDYIQVIGEDAMGESNRINIFQDDADRWKKELKSGNLLRLRLAAPTGGFSTYTLEKNSKMPNRGWALKYPNKDSDYRVFVMSSGDKDDVYQTDEEVLSQFDMLGRKK